MCIRDRHHKEWWTEWIPPSVSYTHLVVNSDILDRYVIKSAEEDDGQGGGVSKQIKDDGWDYNDLHEPLYNPEQLTDLLERNTYHAQACSVVARESGGLGFSIKPVSEEENPDDEHKRVLIKFFKSFKINDVLYRRQYDRCLLYTSKLKKKWWRKKPNLRPLI